MTGSELDQQFRAIVQRATTDTILADTQALMVLGFGAWTSFSTLEKVIIQRGRERYRAQLLALDPPVVTRLHDWRPGVFVEQWVDVKRLYPAAQNVTRDTVVSPQVRQQRKRFGRRRET